MNKALALLLLLAACGETDGGSGQQPAGQNVVAGAVPADDRIDCAVDGAQSFARVCAVEHGTSGILVVRAPSGAFRRLVITSDGRGVTEADGAEPAEVRVLGPGAIEVTIAGDRYRLPATVKAP